MPEIDFPTAGQGERSSGNEIGFARAGGVSACCCESAAAKDERKKDHKYKTGM